MINPMNRPSVMRSKSNAKLLVPMDDLEGPASAPAKVDADSAEVNRQCPLTDGDAPGFVGPSADFNSHLGSLLEIMLIASLSGIRNPSRFG